MPLISRFLPYLILTVWAKVALTLEERFCNFVDGPGGINNAYISICTRRMTLDTKLEIMCPKEADGSVDETLFLSNLEEYDTIRMSDEYKELASYIVRDGLRNNSTPRADSERYKLFPENPAERLNVLATEQFLNGVKHGNLGFWEVFGTLDETIISKREDARREIIKIEAPGNGLLTVKSWDKLMYFCIKEKYLNAIDQNFLKFLSNRAFIPTDDAYLKLHIPLLDYGNREIRVGVGIVVLTDLVLVRHGVSHIPNKFFFNTSNFLPDRNYHQAVFDVMTHPDLGFFCEGIVEPPECFEAFKSFRNGQMFRLPAESLREVGYVGGVIAFGNYNREQVYTAFRGYCDCRDLTGRLVSRIIVERKTQHVCNLNSKLFKHKVQPYRDLWFDVNLHPGDSLTIFFPPNSDNNVLEALRREGRLFEEESDHEFEAAEQVDVLIDEDDEREHDDEAYQADAEDEDDNLSDNRDSESESGDQDAVDLQAREVLMETDEEDSVSEAEADADTMSLDSSDSDSGYNMESLNTPQQQIPNVAVPVVPEGFRYPFATFFAPQDLERKIITFLYSTELVNQIDISSVFVGSAYRVDTSNMSNGELKITYLPMPLAKKRMCEFIYYYWILKFRSALRPDIIAKIRISLSETHTYTRGCETEPTGIFFPSTESENCLHHFNRCKRQGVQHYIYNMNDYSTYGIYCKDTEHIYPSGCGVFMIRGKSNQIEPVDLDIAAHRFPNLHQFVLLKKRRLIADHVSEYHCSCIDIFGVEKSRLTLYRAKTRLIQTDGFGYGEQNRFIVFVGKVFMAMPPYNPEHVRRMSCFTNTLPETEYVPVPSDVYPQHFEIRLGNSYKLSCVTPEPLANTTKVFEVRERPYRVPRNMTLDGVRHEEDVARLNDYTDGSLSPERLFPVNITKYFYQRVEGNDAWYIPTDYRSMLATNITGLRLTVKTVNSASHIPDYRSLHIELPDSSIVIIKEDSRKILRMTYISGAISKPDPAVLQPDQPDEARDEEEMEELGELREIYEDPEIAELGQVTEVTEEPRPSTSEGTGGKPAAKPRGGKRKRGKKRKWNPDLINIPRDVRRMEVWGLYTIMVRATHPYARGCGVNEDSEDFFKPETEKIIVNGVVAGCKVDLHKHGVAAFYCPKPYLIYPPRCFRFMALDGIQEVEMREEIFETTENDDKGLMVIRMKRGVKAELERIMTRGVVYSCFCLTMGGIIRSRIDVTI